ncbi:MAG: L-serine ammonia-lyase [Nocardioides sp.]|uniref:L-serine ammonia-lyase n=1 Tax=Nocardioides sp. TaxID=35761 RepID=UPI0039E26C8B
MSGSGRPALRSVLDLFSIGIGPSSSHTVGPMRAADAFVRELHRAGLLEQVTRVEADLLGSLGATGAGHGTPDAVLAGLRGLDAETCDPTEVTGRWLALADGGAIALLGRHEITMRTDDVHLRPDLRHPRHPNALHLSAWTTGGTPCLERIYLSVGGGTIAEVDDGNPDEITPASVPTPEVPHPFSTAVELLALCRLLGCDIATVVRRNELAHWSPTELDDGLRARWAAMRSCIELGLRGEGVLPGGLGVRRRAAGLSAVLDGEGAAPDSLERLQAYAIAVNEQNAAGQRVVTAPTNGAAGIVPAVLHHHLTTAGLAEAQAQDAAATYLLTATAIGSLVVHNASISGADVGCQGEVGSAAAMAAAGYCALLGGDPAAVENAAEIALEHHLGLTCDPVAGLVQIPCIERNAVAAVTAVSAARLALRGDGIHVVSFDTVVETMRRTGHDMSHRYKETGSGGLAVTVPLC